MEDRKRKEKMSGYEDGESSHAPRSRTMGSDGEDGNRSASAGAAGTLHIQGASPREILPALFLASGSSFLVAAENPFLQF